MINALIGTAIALLILAAAWAVVYSDEILDWIFDRHR